MAKDKTKIGIITMLLSLAALSAILSGIGSAQRIPPSDGQGAMEPGLSMDPGWSDGRMHRAEMPFMGVPVEMIIGGRGFALRDNETHLLKLNVERISPLEPEQIRDLLGSNKSIEEIREAIKAEEGRAQYRGDMMLDDTGYSLINVDVRPLNDTVTAIDADIALEKSRSENPTEIIGHLNMDVSISRGGRIGEGQLEVNSSMHKGSYHLLLEMAKSRRSLSGARD